MLHSGFWHVDEQHRLNWDVAADEWGQQTMAATRDINVLRTTCPALGYGYLEVKQQEAAY